MNQGTATCANSECTERGDAKPLEGFERLPDLIVCGSCGQRCTIMLTAGSESPGP